MHIFRKKSKTNFRNTPPEQNTWQKRTPGSVAATGSSFLCFSFFSLNAPIVIAKPL